MRGIGALFAYGALGVIGSFCAYFLFMGARVGEWLNRHFPPKPKPLGRRERKVAATRKRKQR